jgi:hypothetical protein
LRAKALLLAGLGSRRIRIISRRFKKHLTYANVMATLALFIALGGGSYAAVRLSANSIHSREIARNAVKGSEIANSSVGSAEVRNASLQPVDFAKLPTGPRGERGATGPRGTRGPQGEQGPIGLTGAAGTNAATNAQVRLGTPVDVAAGAMTTLQTPCSPGERAIGGGASLQPPGAAGFVQLTSSYPDPPTEGATPTSWAVGVYNQAANPSSVQFQGYAVCIAP